MSDLISRQAAIDALIKLCKHYTPTKSVVHPHIGFVLEELRDLPSSQPERKRGKWIYAEDEYGIDGYHCDKCGFFVPWDYTHTFINYIEDYHFCPNCGARMVQEGEEDANRI